MFISTKLSEQEKRGRRRRGEMFILTKRSEQERRRRKRRRREEVDPKCGFRQVDFQFWIQEMRRFFFFFKIWADTRTSILVNISFKKKSSQTYITAESGFIN